LEGIGGRLETIKQKGKGRQQNCIRVQNI